MRLSEFKIRAGLTEDASYFADVFEAQAFLIELGQGDPELFVLKSEGALPGPFVGRGSECQVVLIRSQVSILHAQILTPRHIGDPWHLVDLNSTNGTCINEEQLQPGAPTPLEDESIVRFGKQARFRFVTAKSLQLRMRRLDSQGPQEALFLCSDLFSPIRMEFDRPLVFGRSPAASIMLPHKEISRRHAEIERCPEGIFIRDLESANGTYVSDMKVRTSSRVEPGDRISLGPFHFVVRGPEELLEEGVSEKELYETTRTIRGNLQDLPLVELMQVVLDKQRTGVLEVSAENRSGRVTFRDGVVCDAETEEGLNGTLAVRDLMHACRGTYTLHTNEGQEIGPRVISTNLENLMLEEMFDDKDIFDTHRCLRA